MECGGSGKEHILRKGLGRLSVKLSKESETIQSDFESVLCFYTSLLLLLCLCSLPPTPISLCLPVCPSFCPRHLCLSVFLPSLCPRHPSLSSCLSFFQSLPQPPLSVSLPVCPSLCPSHPSLSVFLSVPLFAPATHLSLSSCLSLFQSLPPPPIYVCLPVCPSLCPHHLSLSVFLSAPLCLSVFLSAPLSAPPPSSLC